MAELDLGVFLRDLEHKLGDSRAILKTTAVNLAEETIDLVKQGFVDEADPYGDPWKKKKKKDGRKTLSGPTGRLKTHWSHKATAKGYVVSSSVAYAIFHQNPQPRQRATEQATLREEARAVDTGRRRARFRGADFVGPMPLTRSRRAMVPDERGIPVRWSQKFEEISLEVIAEHFSIE